LGFSFWGRGAFFSGILTKCWGFSINGKWGKSFLYGKWDSHIKLLGKKLDENQGFLVNPPKSGFFRYRIRAFLGGIGLILNDFLGRWAGIYWGFLGKGSL